MSSNILIIAGSDPSGCAGIQADIKTATQLKIFSSAVVTSLTSQDTSNFYGTLDLDINFFNLQLSKVLNEIKFDTIKIGMTSNSKIINSIESNLNKFQNPIIIDPVMISTSKRNLLNPEDIEIYKKKLLPIAYLLTPNIHEAEILANMKITTKKNMLSAALKIKDLGVKNILITGSHLDKKYLITHLLLFENGEYRYLHNKRIDKESEIRGTGCTLSTAIACNIANKINLEKSINLANKFVTRSIKSSVILGSKNYTLKHF